MVRRFRIRVEIELSNGTYVSPDAKRAAHHKERMRNTRAVVEPRNVRHRPERNSFMMWTQLCISEKVVEWLHWRRPPRRRTRYTAETISTMNINCKVWPARTAPPAAA